LAVLTGTKLKPRADRFSIQAPIQYRLSGETAWNRGITKNISHSGVLFMAEKRLETKALVEIQVHFPGDITGSIPANLFCRGLVVRTEPSTGGKWQCGIATSIVRHHLVSE
jgi:hypothetical protein